MNAVMLGRIALVLLLALQPLWYLWWAPPQTLSPAWLAAVASAPLLIPAFGLLRGRASALFWGSLLSLLYFSHGVMEAWANPAERAPALVEIALCLVLVAAVGYDGLQRRRAARRVQPANL